MKEVGVLRGWKKKATDVLRGLIAGLYEDHSDNGESEYRDEDREEEEAESQANSNVNADAHLCNPSPFSHLCILYPY